MGGTVLEIRTLFVAGNMATFLGTATVLLKLSVRNEISLQVSVIVDGTKLL